MVFDAYFDESGQSADSRIVSVAGVAAPREIWHWFNRAWTELLKAGGVKQFHMTDLENRRGEFAAWDDELQRRTSFSRRRHVLGDEAFDGVAAERTAARTWKQSICGFTSPFLEPRFDDRHCYGEIANVSNISSPFLAVSPGERGEQDYADPPTQKQK